MMKLKTSVAAIAVSLFLAACGGGGSDAASNAPVSGSPTTPPVATPAPTPIVPPSDLQTSVPSLTYPMASAEYEFVNALNQFRASVGLGLLAQSTLLDKSARNHLEYVLKNDVLNGGQVNMRTNDAATGRSMFHIENATYPLYTGVNEAERARFVGYNGGYVGEELAFAGGKGGRIALSSLAATIYHRAGLMMQGLRDVGVAVGTDRSQTVTLEFGYVQPQSNASDFVGVYPASNQTGVGLHTYVETPNPFPELSTATDDFPTKTGYPISVVVKEGVQLEVLTFTMTEAGASSPLQGRVMTRDNDPNRMLGTNIAFFVASARLKPNTTYTVSFSGRAANVVIKKDWSFSTGA
ncbi:CAP domain-containing protein [Massilia sp. LjRoot122]|uniref:CAP domain-containing protein n=1 Tax=Massilia sp. LjRoot122 TaxID=3342257 RepID=UPI003ECCFB21